MVPFAFEIEDRVDDVLEHLGPGETAVLGHVSDDEHRHVLTFCREQDLRRCFAHLANTTWRRLHLQREDGLDRIDDEERGPQAYELLEDAFETGLGEKVQRRAANPEPLASQLDLMLRLLARAVEHRTG